MKSSKVSYKIYEKYEYIAKKYSSRIYSYEQLSYEYDDLLQEFKLKLYTSIKAYGRRWLKYRRGTAPKPVPLPYYLEAALSNKSRDFMKYIGRENHKIRIDDINYDFGVEIDSQINSEENKFIVHGVDLLQNLHGKERMVFSMYLKGYNINFLSKVYKDKKNRKVLKINDEEPFTASDIIKIQREFLIKEYGNELRKNNKVFETYNFED